MKTAVYISRITNRQSKGIINKVKNTVEALNKLGYSASAIIFHEHWLRGSMKVALGLLLAKEELIILRSDHHTMLVMFLPMLFARIKGKRIVVDIANPVCAAKREVAGSTAGFLAKQVKKGLLHITFPLSLVPANRILEYGYDSAWFTFGVKRKIKLVGNGVLVESVPFRASKPIFDKACFNLAGAAYFGFWHGYDRVIRSIHAYNVENSLNPDRVRINFYIVGDGFEKVNLIKLVKDLDLEDQVHFLGVKEGGDLARCFENVHVGICNLAEFRKGLSFISELKTRDYTARGIPFILACDDIDFLGPLPFVFRCRNDDSLIDLDEVIEWYTGLDRKYDDFSFMRRFAIQKLDYTIKVKQDILTVI